MRKVLCELSITCITEHTAVNFSVKVSVVTCSGLAKTMLLPNGEHCLLFPSVLGHCCD